jgi:hypothetical protein
LSGAWVAFYALQTSYTNQSAQEILIRQTDSVRDFSNFFAKSGMQLLSFLTEVPQGEL